MKKYIYKSMAALFLFGVALTSCSDFLEAENKGAGGDEADGYFGKDASELLVAAYESLKTITTQVDIYEHGTDLYFNTRGHAGGVFNEYTLTPEEGTIKSFYSDTYKTINYANGVIYYAGNDSQLGYEARFLRNYGYYLLTQQFGSVPYITEYINTARTDYPRTDLGELYTSVIEDLTDLYNNSTLDAQNHDGKANKQAVAALIAKFYLAAGWDVQTELTDAEKGNYTVKNTEYFKQAAAWAEKAINGVLLTMSFEDKWAPANEGNAEEIWSVQYDRASYPGAISDGGHSLQNSYGGYFGNVMDFGAKYTGSDNQPTAKAVKLFEKGDKRYEATFMTIYYNSKKDGSAAAEWGTNGYYAYYNLDQAKLATQPILFHYHPWYVTQEEVEADIVEHKAQYADYALRAKDPQVVRMDDAGDLLVYDFDDEGNFGHYEKVGDENVFKAGSPKVTTYTEYMELTDAFGSVKKFDDPESQQLTKSNDYRDVVILHVSDMYLVAAEAYFMAEQETEALSKINDVRKRAGLEALSSFDAYEPQYSVSSTFVEKRGLDLILDERARELYAERQRWMDLRRTKQLVRYNIEFNKYITDASDMCNAKGEFKWLRPIPVAEISSNTGITSEDQNPGY